jgi:hypothetical protein
VSAGDLLLEGAGTNLLQYSQQLDNVWWTLGNSTLPSTTELAPDGTSTADKWVFDSASALSAVTSNSITKAAIATTYTFSAWAKASGYNLFRLYAREVANNGNRAEATFDVGNGTFSSVSAFGTFTNASAVSVPFPGGWYRCVLIFTTGTETSINVRFNRNDSLTPNGTDGLILWGAQLEQSSYATSYIPTTTSTATRAADVSTSAATFGNSWYEQSEGTVFSQTSTTQAAQNRTLISFDDGTISNAIQYRPAAGGGSSDHSRWVIRANSANQVDIVSYTIVETERYRAAFAFASNDYVGYSKGQIAGTDTSVILPTVSILKIGEGRYSTSDYNGTIRRLTYWPSRLSNDTLQTITV